MNEADISVVFLSCVVYCNFHLKGLCLNVPIDHFIYQRSTS